MFFPQELEEDTGRATAERLHAAMLAIALAAAEKPFVGQFETIAMCLEDASDALLAIGYRLPSHANHATSIGREGIHLMAENATEYLSKVLTEQCHHPTLSFYHTVFIVTANVVSHLHNTSTFTDIIQGRDASVSDSQLNDSAVELLLGLLRIEDKFSSLMTIPDATELYTAHGRITHVLRKFHQLSFEQISACTKHIRDGNSPTRTS